MNNKNKFNWLGLLLILILPVAGLSQSPKAFNYQGLALAANGKPLINEMIEIEISIVQDSSQGTEVFREKHSTMTSAKGIFSIQIGHGQAIFRNIGNIGWNNGTYWIKTFADLDFDQQLEEIGASQLVSVPYALHAATVDNVDDADADPLNELQIIQKNGSTVELFPNGGSFQDDVIDPDADPQNELQNLSTVRNGSVVELNISDGTGVTFSVGDGDDNPLNEIQQLDLTNQELSISDGNSVDLSFLASPWQKRGPTEIFFDKGLVRIEDPALDNAVTVSPMRVTTNLGDWRSRLEATTLIFEPNLQSDSIGASFDQKGASIFKGGVSPAQNFVTWDKDSLKFHYGSKGRYTADDLSFKSKGLFLGDITSLLNSNQLKLTQGGFKAELDAFGACFVGETTDACFNNSGWTIFQGPPNLAKNPRWIMDADSLTGLNPNTFTTHLMKSNPTSLSGEFSLFNGSTGNELFYAGDLGFNDQSAFMALSHDNKYKIVHSTLSGIGQTIYFGPNGNENIRLEEGFHNDNHGHITLHDENGDETGVWGVDAKGRGFFNLAKNQGDYQLSLNTDFISLTDQSNTASWYVKKDDSSPDASQMFFNGANSNSNVYIGTNSSKNNDNIGEITVYDDPGTPRAKLDGEGELKLYGPNGQLNFEATKDLFNNNEGRADIFDQNGTAQAGMFIDFQGFGHLYADVKNFRSDHPNDPTKEIWYASLEGPEAGAYCRGTSQLINGECFVAYPEHFHALVATEDVTVILTPLEWDTYGLAAIKKTATGIFVKELKGGSGNFSFDWEIKGKRRGWEDYQVIQDKKVYPDK